MKIGDIVEHINGSMAIVTDIAMMYPGNPYSPIGRVEIHWLRAAPNWWRRGLKVDATSIRRVVSHGVGKGSQV